jgi:hypothetical protein
MESMRAKKKKSGLAFSLIRLPGGEVGSSLASTFLAILPVEDRSPRDHAGNHPPGGLQDEKEEKDAGTESQQTSLEHEKDILAPNKITHIIV